MVYFVLDKSQNSFPFVLGKCVGSLLHNWFQATNDPALGIGTRTASGSGSAGVAAGVVLFLLGVFFTPF
jgi:hypothetical protein